MKHNSSRFLVREDTGEFVTKMGGLFVSKDGTGKYRVTKQKRDGKLIGEIRVKKIKHGDFNYEDGPKKLVKEVWSFFKNGKRKKLPVEKIDEEGNKIWKPTYGFRTLDETAEKLVRAIKSKQIA